MKAKMKKWLSLLLALALVVSGIATSEITPIYAGEPDSTFTLYYYTKDADALCMNIWNHAAFKFADATETGEYLGWENKQQGLFQAVEGNAGWFSIDLKLESSGKYDGIEIYNKDTKSSLWKCGIWWDAANNKEEKDVDYPTLISGAYEAYAINDGTLYTDLAEAGLDLNQSSNVFTLYYYAQNAQELYLNIWNWAKLKFADTADTGSYFEGWTTTQGKMKAVEGNAGWFSIDLELKPDEGQDPYDGITFYNAPNTAGELSKYSKWGSGDGDGDNIEDYTTLLSGTSKVYAIKNGTLYKSLSEAGIDSSDDTKELTKDDLCDLIDTVPDDYANMNFTDTAMLEQKLAAAEDCYKKANPTSEEIETCYKELKEAISKLTITISGNDIYVDKIATISENDIRGMDVSSYISIMDSFDELNKGKTNDADKLGFRDADGKLLDRQGFFDLLAANDVNYIRLRVWNDPYDADGNGYGGGNNDLAKAVEMGKYATNAGMKVLIDFHFSDFWADPEKQQAPKAWKGYTVAQKADAISDFTKKSLEELISEGVDVRMVQIGNETNGSFCGENTWENMNILFDAGCDAVHEINGLDGEKILAVLHFTNPEGEGKQEGYAASLANYDGDNNGVKEGVSYDVFATSYYPVWHGSLDNLKKVLSKISTTYGKYVMVAETSWANTLEDADGHENTVRRGNNDTKPASQDDWWTISEQGQVHEFRDVLNTVLSIDKGLGAFWWEGAWVPVQNAYEDGSLKEAVVKQNKEMWEKHGSGWASSYSAAYDPDDAGKWYGGNAVDNQGFFDANAQVLPSIQVFNYDYLKYGVIAEHKVPLEAEPQAVMVEVGAKIGMPKTVKVTYNDRTTEEEAVTWTAAELEDVQKKAEFVKNRGMYTVTGTTNSSNLPVSCTITIDPKSLLQDPSFEEKSEDIWSVNGTGFVGFDGETPRSGQKCLHFWKAEAFTFTVSQTISVDQAGVYAADYYAQGATTAKVKLSVSVGSGNTAKETAEMALNGWKNWVCPELDEIIITKDQVKNGKVDVTVTATVIGAAGAWGTLDDFHFYLLSADESKDPEQDPPKQDPPKQEQGPKPAAAGTVLNTTDGSYKVTASKDGAAEVAFTKVKNKKATKVTVPATIKDQNGVTYKVTSIAANTFKNNKKIKTVKLGSNIKSIGKNAFKGCTKLTKVTLDKNLEKIDSSAFAGCTKLASITVSAKVKEIGGNAFAGCKNLKKVTIKSTVLKKVGKNALKNIHKKAVIKVPAKKLSAYKKLLKGKGQAKTVKIKK